MPWLATALLEDLGAALESWWRWWPHADFGGRGLDVAHRLAQRHAGARLNRDDHRRQLGDVLTVSDVGLSERLATVSSGTSAPLGVRIWMRRSTSLTSTYLGSASRITW